ncbi:hypothetical protein TNCV_2839741 [Trichonephila clavipes]|nr:hypothetical protein TNCV_2839741 [Trichonephila clavipes]
MYLLNTFAAGVMSSRDATSKQESNPMLSRKRTGQHLFSLLVGVWGPAHFYRRHPFDPMFPIRHLVPIMARGKWYGIRTMACFVTGSSPVPLKTRRSRMHVKSVES